MDIKKENVMLGKSPASPGTESQWREENTLHAPAPIDDGNMMKKISVLFKFPHTLGNHSHEQK